MGPDDSMSVDRVVSALSEEERYRVLVEAIADYGIYMLDPAGRVATWNPASRRMLGFEADEIIGQYLGRCYTEEDRAAGVPEQALHAAAVEGRFEEENWRVRKDGTRFWAHVVIDPILSPQGDLLGFAKITRDLTEQRAADEALRRSQEQFQLLVQGVTDYALYMLDPDGRMNPGSLGL